MVFVASPDYKKFVIMGVMVLIGAVLIVFLAVSSTVSEGSPPG